MHGDTSVHDSSAQEDVLVARAWQGRPVIRALFPLMGCACSRFADAGAAPPHPRLRAKPSAGIPADGSPPEDTRTALVGASMLGRLLSGCGRTSGTQATEAPSSLPVRCLPE